MTDAVDDAQLATQAFTDAALSQVRRPAVRRAVPAGPAWCVDCGDEIPAARLAAVPDAERCVDCQVLRDARSL
jgi:phage/conjugal plasmid C-4 type zinc finger TraR family protein